MAWHDVMQYLSTKLEVDFSQVHMTLVGPVVLDIVQHFTERWNELKLRKVINITVLWTGLTIT